MPPIHSTVQLGENELPGDVDSTSPSPQRVAEQSNFRDPLAHTRIGDGSRTLPELEVVGTEQSPQADPKADIANKLYMERPEQSQADFETVRFQESDTGSNILSYIQISGQSPTISEFGDEHPNQWNIEILPDAIQNYLEENKLEAYFVKPDGNCLFHAVSFHPKFNKALLTRLGAAGYIEGGKQTENPLFDMVTHDQLRQIRTRNNHV